MTIKKRLFISNILMIVIPVLAALLAGVCCIALLWLMLQNGGGLPLEDSGDFSWASRAVVKLVSRSLEEGKSLDTLGETLQANGLRLTVFSGGTTVYAWGEEQPDGARLLQAAESLGGVRALVSAGEHSLSITHREINGTVYRICDYGTRSGELPSGGRLVIALAGFVLLRAVLAAIWGTNRFLIRFAFQKINGPPMVLSDGVREIGDGNLDYRTGYLEKTSLPRCLRRSTGCGTAQSLCGAHPAGRGEPEGTAGGHLPRPALSANLYPGLCGVPAGRRGKDTEGAAAVSSDYQNQGGGHRPHGVPAVPVLQAGLAEYPMEPLTFRLDELSRPRRAGGGPAQAL